MTRPTHLQGINMRMRMIFRGAIMIGLTVAVVWAIRPGHSQLAIGDESADEETGRIVEREQQRSIDEITVRQLNEFHLAVLGRITDRMQTREAGRREAQLNVEYGGITRDHGTVWIAIPGHSQQGGNPEDEAAVLGHNVRLYGDIGHPLEWTITNHRGVPLFSFWISKRQTVVTVLECDIPSGHLFVNVGWQPSDHKDLDTKQPKLGDFTPRQVLQLLEAGLSDIEKPLSE